MIGTVRAKVFEQKHKMFLAVIGNRKKPKLFLGMGLENTNGHIDYLNSFGIQLQKLLYVQNIKTKIATTNNNC